MQSEGASPLSPFMLWLDQRHALKASRASVGMKRDMFTSSKLQEISPVFLVEGRRFELAVMGFFAVTNNT